MGKLGKRAKKFARKNLQSVAKRQRIQRGRYLGRRAPPRKGGADLSEDEEDAQIEKSKIVVADDGPAIDILEDLFPVNDDDINEELSDSDGYLSEDPDCPYISEDENEDALNDCIAASSALDGTNSEISLEINQKKKKLEKLKRKDPDFAKFLEQRLSEFSQHQREYMDEDGEMDSANEDENSNGQMSVNCKVITSTTIDVWCWLCVEEPSGPALRYLLNAFRTACQYGAEPNGSASERIQSAEQYSKILLFVLAEGHGIFCRLLPTLDNNKRNLSKVKSLAEWQAVRPLVKSYLLSSLNLLNQLTDNKMLIFVLSRLKVSLAFFAVFPTLARRFIKILVHLWASGDNNLSLCSFSIIREIASQFTSEWLDICLIRTYSRFLSTCKLVDDANMEYIELLMSLLVELYSIDIQKSSEKALSSLQQIGKMLRRALKTKKEEDIRKIHAWQYICCIKLWVQFICRNYRDGGLQSLNSSIIEIIRGTAILFSGPRYFPLRFKCIQMLNELSACSGLFIPITYLVLDFLEFRESRNPGQAQKAEVKFSSVLKVSKSLLKSKEFQEECVRSAIELLSSHFGQWSYHVSFPELATIPLILCKRLHDSLTLEFLRRPLKRFIDEVTVNSDYMLKKREEVSFSPSDQVSMDGLFQLEKNNTGNSFTQYYSMVLSKSEASK